MTSRPSPTTRTTASSTRSCHCDQYQYEDSTTYDPSNYSRVDQINLIGAYDTTNNLEVAAGVPPDAASA